MSIVSPAVARHEATEIVVGSGPATVIHDQSILNSETRLVGELGITPWLAAGVVIPVRVFDTSIRYVDSNGDPVAIENPFVHHHDRALVGMGDPWLLARFARPVADFTIGARLGVALPLGRTEEDPFALGDMGLPHEHSQFGTGTFAPLVGLEAARTFGPVRLDTFALTIQALYENSHGYLAGDRYAAGIGAASALGTESWRFRATVEAQHETAEMWHGIIHTDEGNTGRTDVMFGAEVTRRLSDDWYVGATLKLPAYTQVQGGQLDVPVYFGLSVGTRLQVFGSEADDHHGHDHEHDHEHDHVPTDWSGLDKQDITEDGSAVPLVPIAGKITVFDFWATWCEPCEVVDRELAELARRYPGQVAVRKVNVVEVDSPAAKKYLGAYTLPHLKVYGRNGKLVWERSAPPLALSGDVEKLLSPQIAIAAAPTVRSKRIAIEVTQAGYVPNQVVVPRGQPVVLVVTRKFEKTCATDMHFTLPDGTRIAKQLPLDTAVEIPLRIDRAGTITYSCGMDMIRGTIVVK